MSTSPSTTYSPTLVTATATPTSIPFPTSDAPAVVQPDAGNIESLYIYVGAGAGGGLLLLIIIIVFVIFCVSVKRSRKRQKNNLMELGTPQSQYQQFIIPNSEYQSTQPILGISNSIVSSSTRSHQFLTKEEMEKELGEMTIKYSELEILELIGKKEYSLLIIHFNFLFPQGMGAAGQVHKGKWRGAFVAVKQVTERVFYIFHFIHAPNFSYTCIPFLIEILLLHLLKKSD
jgi:hypothetical protein